GQRGRLSYGEGTLDDVFSTRLSDTGRLLWFWSWTASIGERTSLGILLHGGVRLGGGCWLPSGGIGLRGGRVSGCSSLRSGAWLGGGRWRLSGGIGLRGGPISWTASIGERSSLRVLLHGGVRLGGGGWLPSGGVG